MDIKQFAEAWIAAWNSHHLNDILSHYAEDIEVCTPMIKLAIGIDSGKLNGKPAVSNYWEKALQKLPDLYFELLDVTEGVDSIAIYYKSVMNKTCIEVMFFNDEGKINRMYAHYRD
jgi:SnoaL-like domain